MYSFRPDILKNEIKAFFVKYNDPIYVKLEKLDIMIRLASQQNIGQVLAELKEWVHIFLVCERRSSLCFAWIKKIGSFIVLIKDVSFSVYCL